jgi:cysteine-rich repeat protein
MGYVSCDDGNTDSYDGCSSGCDIEDGYDCAGGDDTTADVCVEICGDGQNMGVDECDDSNLVDSDGCSSGCNVEDGWYCFGGDHDSKDYCYEICGDAYHFFYDITNM